MKLKHVILISLILSLFIIIFARVGEKPFVERTKCVGCQDCTRVCPTNAINIQAGRALIDEALCIDCKFCVKACTYRAIRTPK